MHPFDRAWLVRALLAALGYGSLLSLGCGGMAMGGELDPGDPDGDGSGGQVGLSGIGGSGTGATGNGGSDARATGGDGGSGARMGPGGDGGGAGSFSGGGGVSNAGAAGFSGGAGFAGSMSVAGAAGMATMPEPSLCVNLDSGLAGLPSSAFDAPADMVQEYCGPLDDGPFVYQAICLPAPANGQSCTSFYPDYLVTLLYECGRQTSASFLCGPHEPLPATDGCSGDECCYVLVGDCL